MPSRSSQSYIEAFATTIKHFTILGQKPTYQRLDNETSSELEHMFISNNINFQYVPPGNHRANKAERAIRDMKNHLIAMLATANPDCPIYLWDEFIPQANITINLLRPYQPNPTISAYEGMHGKTFDFMANPLAPCGTRVVTFDSPSTRSSWAVHGVKGFYLGPALQHYRCFRVYASTTQAERITDTLQWFPEPLHLPGSNPHELLIAAITNLQVAIIEEQNNEERSKKISDYFRLLKQPKLFPNHLLCINLPSQRQRNHHTTSTLEQHVQLKGWG
jgi:hypothetical protein